MDDADNCPECGLKVGASDPALRVGSPAQRIRGWRSLLVGVPVTIWTLHTRPRALFRVVRGVDGLGLSLLVPMCLVPALITGGLAGLIMLWSVRLTRLTTAAVWEQPVRTGLTTAATALIIFVVLSLIEARGVEFFGKRRGWRTTRAFSRSVAIHAAGAWWVAGVLYVLAGAWGAGPAAFIQSKAPLWLLERLPPAEWTVRLGAFVLGMLVYESLVSVGVMACRYATRPTEAGRDASTGASYVPPESPSSPTSEHRA